MLWERGWAVCQRHCVLTVILGADLWVTILAMGLITIIYDTIARMKAVIYSDVIRSLILLVGIFITIGCALEHLNSMKDILTLMPPERWQAIDSVRDLSGGSETPFWGCLVRELFELKRPWQPLRGLLVLCFFELLGALWLLDHAAGSLIPKLPAVPAA